MRALGDPQDATAAFPGVWRLQAKWTAAMGLVGLLWAWLAPQSDPSLAMTAGLTAGAAATLPLRDAWRALAIPGVEAGAVLAGFPPTLAAMLVAGLVVGRYRAHPTDRLDAVMGAMAVFALTGATLAYLSEGYLMLTWSPSTMAWLALGTSFALWPAAWRHDHPDVPSVFAIARLPYVRRKPTLRAFRVYREAAKLAPDVATRRGLHEVASWVLRLQRTASDIDREIKRIDPLELARHLPPPTATATETPSALPGGGHFARLDEHRTALHEEQTRIGGLIRFAAGFLEDARASLALGRLRPTAGAAPDLEHVLARLREHDRSSRAQQRTNRELAMALAEPGVSRW